MHVRYPFTVIMQHKKIPKKTDRAAIKYRTSHTALHFKAGVGAPTRDALMVPLYRLPAALPFSTDTRLGWAVLASMTE